MYLLHRQLLCAFCFLAALGYAIFIVAASEEGGNVLTKEVLDMIFELDEKIWILEASDLCVHFCGRDLPK